MPPTSQTTQRTIPEDIRDLVRELNDDVQTREFSVDLSTLNEKKRTVEVAASSEYPVRLWYGEEILDHTSVAIRMDRMKNGAPVLDSHGHRSQVGVVARFWLDGDKRTRAKLKFSRGAMGEEILQDIADGVRSHVSIGYVVHEIVLESRTDDKEVYRVIDWEPYEISMVSVPADPTVGVGRTFDNPTGGKLVAKPTTPSADDQRTTDADSIRAQEQSRIAEITAMGDQFTQRDIASQAVAENWTTDQARIAIMDRIKPTATPAAPVGTESRDGLPGITDAGITMRDLEGFNLMRAINAVATGDWKKAGRERAISLAMADVVGKESRGFYVPHAYLAMRLGLMQKTTGKGAELVATDLMEEEFIDIIRNKALVGKLGAQMLTGLVGDADIPKKTAGANFYWLGEDEDVDTSDFDLTTLPLTPKTIAGAVPVTRRMRKQSSLGVERFITKDLVDGIGVAIDYAAIAADGTLNTPVGLLNMTGVNAVARPAPGMAWASMVAMETAVAGHNADVSAMAYLTAASERGAAKVTEKAAGTAKFIWEDGEVNGYRAEVSNNVPAATWLHGDFSQLIFGFWGVMDLQVDQAAKAASDGLVIRVFQDVDFQNRNPQAFSIAQ
ncbi:MAG: phage major capsid protein [Candidatus Thiodiazotropha sp. (ex Epidulcina cf. delphinae)]|nr:phage major capsid protein [Candidatus Thiodiazotropha sp. (ex Epidulcina cf. delphinae)]